MYDIWLIVHGRYQTLNSYMISLALSYFLLVILRQSSTVQHGLIWPADYEMELRASICCCDLQALSYILGRGRLIYRFSQGLKRSSNK